MHACMQVLLELPSAALRAGDLMHPRMHAGWGTGAEERDLIDVGWFSVWVKFVTQWATAATYCWMLVAPTLFPDRQFA